MSAVMQVREPSARYLAAWQSEPLQQLDLVSTAPGGVMRVRELILALAVRGRLVAQRPGETVPVPVEADDEPGPFELPHGWFWAKLGALHPSLQNGASSRGDPGGRLITVLRLADIEDRRVSLADTREVPIRRQDIERFALRDGDILITRVNGSADIVGQFNLVEGDIDAIYCDHFIRMRVSSEVLEPKYLALFGCSEVIRSRISDLFVSTAGQKTVNQGHIASLPIAIPPLAEQARIVARVDELMRWCDALEEKGRLEAEQHARLLSTLLGTLTDSATPEELAANWQRVAEHFDLLLDRPEAVDAVEQTVIQLAIRGSLVPQDRREEPAWKAAERLNCKNSVGVRQKRSAKNASSPDGSDELGPLPVGWARIPLGTVVNVLNGRAYSKSELLDAGPTPVLRVGNLFTSRHWYYSDLELDAEKYCEPGDLLYAWSASFGPVIWSGPRAIFHYHIWKLQPVCTSDFNIDFFYLFLLGKTAEIKAAGHGVAMTHMTKEKMEAIAVPYPPLAEQGRIVARVKQIRSLCATLRQRLLGQQATQSRLAEALVEQALAG